MSGPLLLETGNALLLEGGLGPLQLQSLGSNLAGFVGVIPANYTMLPNSYFDLTAIEYIDASAKTAWDAGIPSFPTQWGTSPSCSITRNTINAPDGTLTGCTWTENSNNSFHMLRTYITSASMDGSPTRCAVIVKAGTRTRIVVQMSVVINTLAFEYSASVGFDLAGGNVGYDVVAGTGWTITGYNMTALPGGWWLCTFDAYNTAGVFSPYWYVTTFLDAGSGTAARNISYAGDGASGLYVWWASMLPKGAWPLNQVFLDDFTNTSTIDLTNSRAPGFNWYIANSWSNCVMTGFAFNSNPPTVAGSLSASGSVLNWVDTTTTNTNYIYTAAPKVGDPSQYVGQVWGAPAMFEARMAWGSDPVHAPTWPAFWADSIEGLVGSQNEFVEIDFMEHFDQSNSSQTTSTAHVWQGPSTEVAHSTRGAAQLNTPGFSYQNMNLYSTLWLSSASNNGAGVFMNFFDGLFIPNSVQVFATSDPYAVADTQHMAVILAGGNVSTGPPSTWPTSIDWVKIYN